MVSEIAENGYLALATQTALGTPATVDGTLALRVTSCSLSGQADRLDDDDEIGGGRDTDASAAVMGVFKVGGTIEGMFRAKVFGYLLLAAGFTAAAPVQDATTGAYTHTFTPGSTVKYLTILVRWGLAGAVRQFSDCLVDELSLSLDANGKVTWSASIVGRTELFNATGVTPTYETSPIANYDGSALTFDGLGTYKAESMGLTIANNLSDDETVIGSRMLDDVTPGNREVTISTSIKVGSTPGPVTDLYRAAVFGSKTATGPTTADPYHTSAALTFASRKLIGTSLTKRFGLVATVPDAVMAGFPLEASGSDRLTVDVEAKAYKGAGAVVSIDLSNDRSTIYS